MRVRPWLSLSLFSLLLALPLMPILGQNPSGREEQHDFSKVSDEEFAKMAEQINLTEIAAGQIAVTKGKKAEVQEFGKKMITDHTNANRNLSAALKGRQELAGKLDSKHQAKVDKLKGLDGDQFDRAYIQEMVTGHKMATQLFEYELKNGKDENLKKYASETLPHVRMHLKKAEQIWKDSFGTATR